MCLCKKYRDGVGWTEVSPQPAPETDISIGNKAIFNIIWTLLRAYQNIENIWKYLEKYLQK